MSEDIAIEKKSLRYALLGTVVFLGTITLTFYRESKQVFGRDGHEQLAFTFFVFTPLLILANVFALAAMKQVLDPGARLSRLGWIALIFSSIVVILSIYLYFFR